jgi:superfamily II DNA or RNA helicase
VELYEELSSSSFLEYAFLRWVLSPAVIPSFAARVVPQAVVEVDGHSYRIDYEFAGAQRPIAVELDGFEFHSSRPAFSYDRLRQNDLTGTGRDIIRFSYDSIRSETERCVAQLQTHLRLDPALASYVLENPVISAPEMDPDPLCALQPSPEAAPPSEETEPPSPYFETVRRKLNLRTLRQCQSEAFAALANYYGSGGLTAACVMSVGSGKTALGVLSCLTFTRRRALVVTPGSVIRGTFDRAFDRNSPTNVLFTLPGGPLIVGIDPPKVLTLDRDNGPIKDVSQEQLLAADIILTNFHSLDTGEDPDDLLAKLEPDDIDFIVVDEAHIAAAESYQRLFRHFAEARTLLMSACFQRLDGKPIDADVVYRYRLIDSIADGNAKNLRIGRFAPDVAQTIYEIVWPEGACEQIVGRDALLDIIGDEHKLASITAKSTEPISQVMRAVRIALDLQAELLQPVKPRVLFSALGEAHAEQIAAVACEHGISTAHLHYSMGEAHIRSVRQRFESTAGDLQGIVQLKMLGQGYDFPPISVVVPMRPYASFAEFYQFVGRGIRAILDPALAGRVGPGEQFLDVIYHAELGLDDHVEALCLENDMDPLQVLQPAPEEFMAAGSGPSIAVLSDNGEAVATGPETYVLFEKGVVESHVLHDIERVDKRQQERVRAALAQRYSAYVASDLSTAPLSFEEYVKVIESARE